MRATFARSVTRAMLRLRAGSKERNGALRSAQMAGRAMSRDRGGAKSIGPLASVPFVQSHDNAICKKPQAQSGGQGRSRTGEGSAGKHGGNATCCRKTTLRCRERNGKVVTNGNPTLLAVASSTAISMCPMQICIHLPSPNPKPPTSCKSPRDQL